MSTSKFIYRKYHIIVYDQLKCTFYDHYLNIRYPRSPFGTLINKFKK